MVTFFIFLQTTLFGIIFLHDWIDFPPYTDITALKKNHSFSMRLLSTIINSLTVGIPLFLTWYYFPGPFPHSVIRTILIFYLLLTIGTICSWWIPYILGSSKRHKAGFVEYTNTHTFLPSRGDNVVPNTLHVILHLFVWACLACALFLFCCDH